MRTCGDKKCKGYGKPLVDKGYGYPVCPTTPSKNSVDVGKIMDPIKAFVDSEKRLGRRTPD